jgi:hypothetical protein
MLPKEKAQELVNQYLDFDYQLIKEYIPNPIACAVKCALIAVDEIIDTLTELFNEHIHNEISETLIESKIIYYQEVKNELNQL